MNTDPNWTEWAEWLGKDGEPGPISKEVFGMLAARQMWESFQDIVSNAPRDARKHRVFHSWFNASYLQAQGLAVRRQADADSSVVSLGRLLVRVAKSPGVLSRERYLSERSPDDQGLGNEFFDKLVGLGADALDASVPRADFKRLQGETAKVRKWVDKEVAHYDRKAGVFGQGLTFDDIHRSIDVIFETYNRYCQLILGTTVLGAVVLQPWEANFKVAWLDEGAFQRVRHAALERERGRMGVS
jgi:hypothetical protein